MVYFIEMRFVAVLNSASHEFLRDGDQLAARMTSTIKVDGVETEFESFMFAKVDVENRKMEWMIERSVWGPVGGPSEHGVN
jgi:hypothetical protein